MTRIPLYNDHLRVRDVFQLALGWVLSPYLKIFDVVCLLFFKAFIILIIFFVLVMILALLFPKQNNDDEITFVITNDGKEIPWEKSKFTKKEI